MLIRNTSASPHPQILDLNSTTVWSEPELCLRGGGGGLGCRFMHKHPTSSSPVQVQYLPFRICNTEGQEDLLFAQTVTPKNLTGQARPGREVKWCMPQWESGIFRVSEPHHKYCSAVQNCQIYTSFVLCYKTIGIQTLSNILHILEPTISAPATSLMVKQQFFTIIVNVS